MDRGVSWAIVQGVAESWIRLIDKTHHQLQVRILVISQSNFGKKRTESAPHKKFVRNVGYHWFDEKLLESVH